MGHESLAYMFPGQGSQQEGMAKKIFERDNEDEKKIAELTFEEANDILSFNILNLCLQGSKDILKNTRITQPAIFVTSIAALRIINLQTDDKPSVVAGHSLGEYTALVAAESLTFAQALRLVQVRGELMEEAGRQNPGKMAAVLLTYEEILDICQETGVEIANINSPKQIVISGNETSILEATQLAVDRKGRVISLDVSVAAHSSMMREPQKEMTKNIMHEKFKDPVIPVVPNVYPYYVFKEDKIKECLIDQMTGTVRWLEGVKHMINKGVHSFVEIGPGEVLTNLVKRIDADVEVTNTDTIFSFHTVNS